MKKIVAIVSIVLLSHLSVKAVIADPTPFLYTLEDGTTVTAVLHGDEYHSYITDTEGRLLSGTYPTPEINEARALRRAQQIQSMGKNYPLQGHPKTVAILVNFQDVKFQHTREEIERLVREQGYSENGATGSVYDYFMACSNGQFAPDVDVYGPYTVRGNRAEYGARVNDQQNDKDAAGAFIEACQKAEDDGVDFTKYDVDGDGTIDNVFFYYAGNNEAEGGGEECIWPHQSSLGYRNIRLSGKLLDSYACTSECRGRGNILCAIGTFCHEFGHVLGLPDTYNTENGSIYTVGSWDVMCSGNYNNSSCTPPLYNAWEQFYLGWLKPTQLSEAGNYILKPLESNYEAYLIASGEHNLNGSAPSPNEFFLLEYRAATGWDSPKDALPGEGMLVWHIDYSSAIFQSNKPNNSTPLRVHLEEAGGNKGTSTPSDPYPGIRNIRTFTPTLHNGTTLSDQIIYNIAEQNGVVTFIYKNNGKSSISTDTTEISFTVHMNDAEQPIDWAAHPVQLHAEGLSAGEKITLTASRKNNFYVAQNEAAVNSRTSKYWMRTLTLSSAADSIGEINTTFYVSYNPTKTDCAGEATVITLESKSANTTLAVNGSAPRATLVKTPVVLKETELSPYSVTLNWKEQTDAEEYYITVYQVDKGTTEYVQDFENFNSMDKIIAQGWQSTTTTTTTAAKKDGQRSLALKKTGDSFTTEVYPTSITKVSMWINTMNSTVDTVGHITLEGSSDGKNYSSVYEYDVPNRTLSKTLSIELAAEKAYSSFRLTYTDMGGNGVAVDAFTATASEKINYIHRGRDIKIDGAETSYTLTNLTPSSKYFYQIQCTDLDKGCEEHLTALSAPRELNTPKGEDPESGRLMIEVDKTSYEQTTGRIYFPEIEEGFTLFVYDQAGHMVYSTPVGAHTAYIALPPQHFIVGRLYIAKYSLPSKISRKDRWVKFIF